MNPPLARHGMEDDSFQHAALLLRHTGRDDRPMFPRSDWRMRMLYLGLVSNRLQAVPLNTSISFVRAL
jgi:hypothetical protein